MQASVPPLAASTDLVLDSWPILEWLKARQPTAPLFREIVEAALTGGLVLSMSRINYGEVLYSVHKAFRISRIAQVLKAFHEIPIRFYSVDDTFVEEAAVLKSFHAISYADAFAAALAIRLDLPLLTGDKELLQLQSTGLKMYWLGA